MFTEDLLGGNPYAILIWIITFNTYVLWIKNCGYFYFSD